MTWSAECTEGAAGPRGAEFNMRWIASTVAEVHRILLRGGLFMHTRDSKDPARPGRLRLLYQANPMAMIVEQAGGAASTGYGRLLDVQPADIHQRVPVILGSRREVERLERYHAEYARGDDRAFDLRRMPDYVNYICPQFSETHVNFQRVPTVDTSNPFIARDVPSADESMLVIRFRNPKGIDMPYLLSMLADSFMSRANTIVCPGSKMPLAMQLIFTPMILQLMDRRKRAF